MLYKLNLANDGSRCEKVERTTLKQIGWSEKDLEKLISENIQDFISTNDLMVVFNERARQEEPDILAVDQSGDLYIFELKRWVGRQENLLQVLRYGQMYGQSNYEDLNDMYRKYQESEDCDLAKRHADYFAFSKPLARDTFNKNQHFIVVANGLDQQTIESIIYWRKNGLSVDAIVYWVFKINDQNYIEFSAYSQVDDYLEYESNSYVLNTNMTSDPKYTDEMLSEKKAAAYYPGWREKIQKFQKGDLVFLYKSGTGIIAYGKADGKVNKAPCDGHNDYEYNMKLNKFTRLESPISPSEMKRIANQSFNFMPTLFSISEEAATKILQHIKESK